MNAILVFPGQGSQYVGMSQHLPNSQRFLDFANDVLGYDLKKIMLQGPQELLKETAHTQPAIVAHSLMLFEELKKILDQKNIKVTKVLGHSVGEYSALAAAGVLSFEDALKSVHLRGKFMQEAADGGTMFAILKQPQELLELACREASTTSGIVSIANYNSPQQIVISGHREACLLAIEILTEKTKQRVKAIELEVSAPFHCPLMKTAELKLAEELKKITFHHLHFPYIANIDAHEYNIDTDPDVLRNNLIEQVCSSVQWTQSIQSIQNTGPSIAESNLIIECGPGKVLSGLIKKINPDLKVLSLDEEGALEKLIENQ